MELDRLLCLPAEAKRQRSYGRCAKHRELGVSRSRENQVLLALLTLDPPWPEAHRSKVLLRPRSNVQSHFLGVAHPPDHPSSVVAPRVFVKPRLEMWRLERDRFEHRPDTQRLFRNRHLISQSGSA